MNKQENINQHFKRNVIGITGAEVFWGLGLPLVLESTFLQLFLKNLGASSFVIGLIPSFFFIGISVFALYGDYATAYTPYKRRAVIAFHVMSGFALLVFGVALFIFGKTDHILVVFIVCYAIFSICLGMTVPVWQNYLTKIFSEEKTVSALSFMMIGQNVAKLISSFFIVKLIDRYSFSINSSAGVFVGVGALFALGGLFFLLTREGKLGEEYA
ncbi:MFS transporter, partial [bacterium]|nr:MFS transporter [bacterium]